ncbi:MAG TPA: hypothetical protein PKD18_14880 [Saprospiraceae bacterium]|nr:hypothetical protein [Saprospiraceae bacterium]HOY13187.1 hypothetical protein [Saprospiraceae bacterium]HPN68533.1 hypothetical protein [Saprospiraceae bacterium]
MWYNFLLGFVFIIGVMAIWAFIQSKWKIAFSEEYKDEDVLAQRSDCHGCGKCTNQCTNKESNK